MSTFNDFKRHLQDKALNFFLRVKYLKGENIRCKLQDFYSDFASSVYPSPLYDKLNKLCDVDLENSEILAFISEFTLSEENRSIDIDKCKDGLLKKYSHYIDDVNMDGNHLEVVTKDGVIKVDCLHSKVEDGLSEYGLKDLQSKTRYGVCHQRSMEFANFLENESKVVTGKVYDYGKFSHVLHTWVELYDGSNEEVCIDYTRNAIIDKSSYYRLFHVDESSLHKCTDQQIKEDMPNIEKLKEYNYLLFKLYLTDREKCINVFEKHRPGEWVDECAVESCDTQECNEAGV